MFSGPPPPLGSCRLPNPSPMYYTALDSSHTNNMSNAFVALFSGLPAYFAALTEQSAATSFMAIVLPFVFFLMGKGIDVAIRIYFERRAEQQRLNGTKDDSNRS